MVSPRWFLFHVCFHMLQASMNMEPATKLTSVLLHTLHSCTVKKTICSRNSNTIQVTKPTTAFGRNHIHRRPPHCHPQAHRPNSSQEKTFLANLVRVVTDEDCQIVRWQNVCKTLAREWHLNPLLIADHHQSIKNLDILWRSLNEFLEIT